MGEGTIKPNPISKIRRDYENNMKMVPAGMQG